MMAAVGRGGRGRCQQDRCGNQCKCGFFHLFSPRLHGGKWLSSLDALLLQTLCQKCVTEGKTLRKRLFEKDICKKPVFVCRRIVFRLRSHNDYTANQCDYNGSPCPRPPITSTAYGQLTC